jgi:glycosyltransferase involved in cell wall biosynthesis
MKNHPYNMLLAKFPFFAKCKNILFRNDDVSFDTDLSRFREFCDVFHKNGYQQLHAVTLYGNLNAKYKNKNGIPTEYYEEESISLLSNEKIKLLSQGKFIGERKDLVDFLNSIPDSIALHGLYHTDYSKMSYQEQEIDIKTGLKLLSDLFPQKKISVFVAPFNRTNTDTFIICKMLGLRVSAMEGKHLEELIGMHNLGVKKGEVYRYHHHRFYPESTFDYYKLDIDRLDMFLRYKKRRLPSLELINNYVEKCNTQKWYVYAFEQFRNRKHCYMAYQWIKKNIMKHEKILESGCGCGGMLYHLHNDGYLDLSGYDIDETAISAGKSIAHEICAPIDFFVENGFDPRLEQKYNVIVGINWIYHVLDFSLDVFIEKHSSFLIKSGYLVFDMIDISYNNVENNWFCTQDWQKPIEEKRPSEYLLRYSEREVESIADKYNFRIVKIITVDNNDVIPRKIYILQKKVFTICFLCDRPNWAFDISASEIIRHLSDEFNFKKEYVIDKPNLNPNGYDLIHIFFWGETYHKQFNIPKDKVLKCVESHRWQFEPQFGLLNPREMAEKYLYDAKYINCISKRLFTLFQDIVENVFCTENGFSPEKFYYETDRTGEISICFAGNTNDPVKGIEDIFLPACGSDLKYDLANNLKHSELRGFYNAHDVYAVCSKNEGGPLPLLESMACGCFPVCCDVGIVPELVVHKKNGYIVSERTVETFREAFYWCRENIEFIRHAGKQNAQLLHDSKRWDIMAKGFRNLYKICLQKGKTND